MTTLNFIQKFNKKYLGYHYVVVMFPIGPDRIVRRLKDGTTNHITGGAILHEDGSVSLYDYHKFKYTKAPFYIGWRELDD